jgi:uncharacterized membrane protein
MNEKTWFQKYWKTLLVVLVVIFLVFYVSAFSGVWADRNYKTNFWPNFFMWSAIIIGGGMFVGWVIGWIGQNRKK